MRAFDSGQIDRLYANGSIRLKDMLTCQVCHELLFDAVTAEHKASGKLEQGVLEVRGRERRVVRDEPVLAGGGAGRVAAVEVAVDYGLSWEEALAARAEAPDAPLNGFYVHAQTFDLGPARGRPPRIRLVTEIEGAAAVGALAQIKKRARARTAYGEDFIVNDPQQPRLDRGWRRAADAARARAIWQAWFDFSAEAGACVTHGGACTTAGCHLGCRLGSVHLLAGAVLPHFMRLCELHEVSPWVERRRYRDRNGVWCEAKLPLRVARATDSRDGRAVVGLEAPGGRAEMEYWVRWLLPGDEEDDPIRRARGTGRHAPGAVRGLGGGPVERDNYPDHWRNGGGDDDGYYEYSRARQRTFR